MDTIEIPPLELRLEDADKYKLIRVGQEFNGNPVYGRDIIYNTYLYRLVIRKNGFPDKKMLVWFYTGRED